MSEALTEKLRAGIGDSGPRQQARHAVNEAMIAHWCDAMGERNPLYTDPAFAAQTRHGGIVAPPAMLDVWDRAGLLATRSPDSPRGRVLEMLDGAGFTGVVAVTSELEFVRYVRPGEILGNVELLDDVSEEKQTGLGIGHFVTTRHRYTTDEGEHVGDVLFRVLKFRPGTGRAPAAAAPGTRPAPDANPALRPRPAINRDNQFFWDGARAHELRIQRCQGCASLFFPPTPRCPECGSFDLGYTVSSGRATLYSYALPHYPQAPGFAYPVAVGLVELAEGTRLVSNIVGVSREDLTVGMPLQLCWLDSHPAQVPGATDSRGPVSLPQFRPADPARRPDTAPVAVGDRLPLFAVPITPTLIVAGAVATRDYNEAHHDRDIARARGSKDMFTNINTAVGLLQRYVSDALGPAATFRAIRVRLGAPNYPGDTMTFTGRVTEVTGRDIVLAVRARNALGDHVTGTVELTLDAA